MSAREIADAILGNRKVLLWVGAGASLAANIPVDTDTEEGLAYRLALVHYGNNRETILAALGQRFRLAELARAVQKARVRELIIQQGWMDFSPTGGHRAIAAIVAEGFPVEIVTVNYDPLLEKALMDEGLDPAVIHSAATVRHLANDSVFVVKLHGCPYRDNDPAHLLMLTEELEAPPPWVTNFLNGRVGERVFLYIGFSGSAAYVRASVRNAVMNLEGNINDAFGIDIRPVQEVFDDGDSLGEFYRLSNVNREHYLAGGAEEAFPEVANTVFRDLMLRELATASEEAARHECGGSEWLAGVLAQLRYEVIRLFARKLGALSGTSPTRLRDLKICSVLEWILILTAKQIIDRQSFSPKLACPYYPGNSGSATAPVVFFDGLGKEAAVVSSEIPQLLEQDKIKNMLQVGAEPRWYAIIVNCKGNLDTSRLEIIERQPQTIVNRYDAAIAVDENTMLAGLGRLEELFQ